MKLAIRHARLRGREAVADILIEDGHIAAIGDGSAWRADQEIDAQECLVLPGFVEPHVHLDKALLGEKMRPSLNWSVEEGIEITIDFKRNYQASEVCERAVRVLKEAVRNGTTTVRSFVDVGTIGRLVPVEGLLAAREAMKSVVDVELVGIPQEGLVCDPGAADLLDEALRMGVAVVGGMPAWEYTDADAREHIDICFELADRYQRPIHMIVDPNEDPNSRSLEYLAVKTLRSEGYHGRVSASWDTLASYNDAYATKVINLIKAAGITIVHNSHVHLMAFGRTDSHPLRRGVTRVRELLNAGVNVAAGQDDVNDPYYPFGKPDQLEVAFFMSHMAHLGTVPGDLEIVLDMVTVNAARALGLSNYGVEVGCRADLVVIDAPSVQEALRMRSDRRAVIKSGRLVAQWQGRTELLT